MRVKVTLAILAVVVALGACSSTSKTGQRPVQPTPNHPLGPPAGFPSTATKMICATEAKKEIAATLGYDTTAPLKPSWDQARRIYACDYLYRGGAKMTVSVEQAANTGAATAYFALLGHHFGKKRILRGLGEAAFVTPQGGIVARRDDKVLLVDVSKVPARFGKVPDTRSDIATTVAAVIMGCWGGGSLIGK